MGRLIDIDKYMEYLRAEINTEADIIAKYIKEDDPIGTVKDCGRIGRLQGLQWNRNMLELDRFTVEAIPKADYENRLKVDMLTMLENLNLEIDEMFARRIDYTVDRIQDLIQQKIDKLKENKNESY